MRIKRLIVTRYKNVENLNLQFGKNLITLLVGRNGLGKSNLIEILAIIFKSLDQIEIEQEFKDWPYDNGNFEYEIIYECNRSEVKVKCYKGVFQVFRRQKGTEDEYSILEFVEFKRNRKDEYLPKYIIGYYSGENKRIKNIIRPYEEEVLSELKKNEGLDNNFRRMFFGENHHAQLILLTLLLYKEQNGHALFQNKATELIDKYCSFSALQEILLILKQPVWHNRNRKTHNSVSIQNLEQNLLSEPKVEFPFWGIKGKAHKLITYFYNNSLNGFSDEDEGKEIFNLSSINKNDLAAGVYAKFDHPINFFDAFESLQQIEAIDKITLRVKSKYNDTLFDFSELSEGEQQLVTVLGLILIAGKDDCLFLLDEPDTHLNPQWQRDYVQLLEDFNLNDDNSHIVVATHSPLIVQAAEATDIFLYKQNKESGKIAVDGNEEMKIHNWRIDQVLASDYFGFENTRPPKLDDFMKAREDLLSKPELTIDDIQMLKSFEEDEDLLPSGETLNDFLAMHLIHKTANRIQQNGTHQ